VHEKAGGSAVQIVGREAELETLEAFLEDAAPALVITGGPGIGKTTLWEAGVSAARDRGIRVLTTRASGAEAQLSFGGLIDLLDGVSDGELAALPPPQLHALAVALLRAEPAGVSPQSGAISLGFLNALRTLAAREPVLVAVDDAQWLDAPSGDSLAFVARRLGADTISLLLTRRPGGPSTLERALETGPLERLEVAPLSFGATRRLLSERLGLSLPRHLLRQLVDATLGNPLFSLEVGRMLAEDGLPAVDEGLPVPDAVEDMLGTRVARLPPPQRRLLLAVALSADLRTDQLVRIAGVDAVEDAQQVGLLVVDGERIRASHPLLAAAARKRSRPRARRELHGELAGVVADEELRARHLALAAEHADDGLAATVATAAAAASARGARRDAVELGEYALRLTPAVSAERNVRLLALAEYLVLAGEPQRATDLVAPEAESLPSGPARARAWLILAGGAVTGEDDIQRYFSLALDEDHADAALRVSVLVSMAEHTAVIRVARIREAEARATEALAAARTVGPEVERIALYALAWARALSGRPIDEVCRQFATRTAASVSITKTPERVAGQRLFWRGQVDDARAVLARLLAEAEQRGEPYSYALLRLHLCNLELRTGDCEAAEALLEEWAADLGVLVWPMYERCRALLAAVRGLPAEAERWAAETVSRAETTGNRWDLLEALRARGTAALLAHEPERAVESLRSVWEHTQREGVDEPGTFPVAPDLVEALVELGDLDEARAVTARLAELARRQDHPWALASAKRCDALVRLGSDEDGDRPFAALDETATAYGALGLGFDRARTLLLLGRAHRRRKKWAAARRALEQAAADFEDRGSPGWAEEARFELARVGARRPAAVGELTPTEQRVVDLAIEGLSNKEIAQALVVTVNTVETHLVHAYAKLGVHSRSQLARARSAQA
jgi:DNA-binding NarL/FixJ family response regulator